MIWLILFNVLIWLIVYLILTVDSKWLKILFAVILVVGIVYVVWSKPDFAYANPTRTTIVNIICDVIGLILLYPKFTDNKKEK